MNSDMWNLMSSELLFAFRTVKLHVKIQVPEIHCIQQSAYKCVYS